MEQVTWRPTSAEVDDYTEYKRLQKIYRDQRHKDPQPTPIPQPVVEAAPSIPPLATSTIAPQSMLRMLPSMSRQPTFKEPSFDAPRAEADRPSASDVVSPLTVPGLQASFFAPQKVGTLAIPASKDKLRSGTPTSSDTASREKQGRVQSPSSNLLASTKSGHGELKEIIPWIDLEAELPTPPPPTTPPSVTERQTGQTRERLEVKAAEMNPVKNVRTLARDSRQPSDLSVQSQDVRARTTATSALNPRLHSTKSTLPILMGKKARFFDGAGYSADEEDDDYHAVPSRDRRFRSSSLDDLPILHSPRPVKPPRPISLFDHGIENIEFTSPLDNIIAHPRAASPIDSLLIAHHGGSQTTGESIALGKLRRWLSK